MGLSHNHKTLCSFCKKVSTYFVQKTQTPGIKYIVLKKQQVTANLSAHAF
jgi:hypothetical protein